MTGKDDKCDQDIMDKQKIEIACRVFSIAERNGFAILTKSRGMFPQLMKMYRQTGISNQGPQKKRPKETGKKW
jgi:hypothetical protein